MLIIVFMFLDNHHFRFDASKPVSLESGMYYFIDALQTAIGGKRNSIKIGVEMPSGKSSFPIRKELLSQFPPSKTLHILDDFFSVPMLTVMRYFYFL